MILLCKLVWANVFTHLPFLHERPLLFDHVQVDLQHPLGPSLPCSSHFGDTSETSSLSSGPCWVSLKNKPNNIHGSFKILNILLNDHWFIYFIKKKLIKANKHVFIQQKQQKYRVINFIRNVYKKFHFTIYVEWKRRTKRKPMMAL